MTRFMPSVGPMGPTTWRDRAADRAPPASAGSSSAVRARERLPEGSERGVRPLGLLGARSRDNDSRSITHAQREARDAPRRPAPRTPPLPWDQTSNTWARCASTTHPGNRYRTRHSRARHRARGECPSRGSRRTPHPRKARRRRPASSRRAPRPSSRDRPSRCRGRSRRSGPAALRSPQDRPRPASSEPVLTEAATEAPIAGSQPRTAPEPAGADGRNRLSWAAPSSRADANRTTAQIAEAFRVFSLNHPHLPLAARQRYPVVRF